MKEKVNKMSRFTEKSVVEDYIVEQLGKKGWNFIPSDKLERDSLEEPLLLNNLIRQIKKINDVGLNDEDIKNILNELKFKPCTQEGVKQILYFLKNGISIKLEKQKTLEKIKLFDYDNIENNEFIITKQVYYNRGNKTIRTDIMLYINGIPLVDIECKNSASFSENWYDAFTQIKEYEDYIPELYKYVQIGIAAEQVVKYFPIIPWQKQEDIKTHEWKEEQKDPIDSIIEMLSKEVLLDIIRNFLFYRIEFGNATKVIIRYMQYHAVNKLIDRVANNIQGNEEKNKGLIWHWQGSGKTLEMIFAANKLYHLINLENPTIFFIIDRLDLEEQLFQEFVALDIIQPDIISSISELRKILSYDEGKGKRGIMITLVHKFRTEELNLLRKELEDLSKNQETILTRKNVIAFIDEGHRTQYGTLAAQMRDILRNAFFFAFTGTPISKPKKGIDTYEAFSYPPEEKYLDKYFITDSIKDGFTVKIAYQPRLEEDIQRKKEMLDTFLEIQDEELPEEIRESVKEDVKKKISIIRAYLENPERIKKISEDIAKHFKENLDGKFKAMVVGVSRKACVHYKKELDKLLPKEYSEVVMTFNRNDPKIIEDYLKELTTRFKDKEIGDIRKKIIERFKEEEHPKILIVTDMLLTGFDAPILQTLYLDKPLKEHRLLQAIARTNRPYKDVKEAGLILDYLGILKEFKRAFEIYSKEEIKGALYNLDEIRNDFIDLVNQTLNIFKDISKTEFDRKTLLQAIEILTSDEEISKKFLESYKSLRKIFELLGPDVIKARLFSEYQWITAIHIYYIRLVLRSQPSEKGYIQKYFNKTIKVIHKITELDGIKESLPIIEFDENYLKELDEKIKGKEEKAANIVFTLNRFVLVDKYKNPVYESLSEKVERLLKAWKEKTKDFEKIYSEGVKITKKINSLWSRQKKLEFSDMEYSLLLDLEKIFGKDEKLIKDIKELSKLLQDYIFPGWVNQPTAKKNVERIVRKFMRQNYIKRYDIKLDDFEKPYGKVMEDIKQYGKKR